MRRVLAAGVVIVMVATSPEAIGRGFGGVHYGGGFHYGGGVHYGGWGGERYTGFRYGDYGYHPYSYGYHPYSYGYHPYSYSYGYHPYSYSYGYHPYDYSYGYRPYTYAGGERGGVVIGPRGGVAGGGERGGVVEGRIGGVAAGERGGVVVGPRGGVAAGGERGVTGFRYPSDLGLAHYGELALNRGAFVNPTRYVAPAALRTQALAVRNNFYNYNLFTPGWYRLHPGIWWPNRWVVPFPWYIPTWPVMVSFCDFSGPPIYYDYGTTIVYNNNYVYNNGNQVCSAPEYTQQAVTIADRGQAAMPPADTAWQPLGVFALVQGDGQESNNIFQLAIDKEGVLRGNYYNALTETSLPVTGAVDRKTQRAAWIVGDRKETVYDAGVANLMKDEAPVLVHFGKDKTQQWLLVRLKQPEGQK